MLRAAVLTTLLVTSAPALAAAGPTECYNDRDGIYAAMDTLLRQHPDLLDRQILGWSPFGNPIYAWRVAHARTNRVFDDDSGILILTAGVHGDEYRPAEMLYRFAWTLVTNYEREPLITRVVDTTEVWLVPVVNVDSFANGTYPGFRDNGSGQIDLARNFPVPGAPPPEDEPEPETRAVMTLLGMLGNTRDGDYVPSDQIGLYIDVHESASVTMHAYSGRLESPHCELPWINSHFARRLQTRAIPNNRLYGCPMYPPYDALGYAPYEGSPVDYAYGVRGLPAFTFELRLEEELCSDRLRTFASCDAEAASLFTENQEAFLLAAQVSGAPYRMADGAFLSPGTFSVRADRIRARFETVPTLAEFVVGCDHRSQDVEAVVYTIYDRPSPGVWTPRRRCEGLAMRPSDGAFGDGEEWVEATLPAHCAGPGGYIVLQGSTRDYVGPEAVFSR